ncbi:MAG: hypothetical protein CMJ89_14155 [Planctomycetes bacterium]|nr:hypothetical protein [Planctomycetota bacterium]
MNRGPLALRTFGVCLFLQACGGTPDSFFAPRPLRSTLPAETALECLRSWVEPSGATVGLGDEPGEFRIELPLPPSAWIQEESGNWRAQCSLGFDLRRLEANACSLVGSAVPLRELASNVFEEGRRGYLVERDSIVLCLDEKEAIPDTLALSVSYFFARLQHGASSGGISAWRPIVGGHTGVGFPVPSGTALEIGVDVFPHAYLRFFAVAEPLALGFDELEECEVVFRVEYDGELILEQTETARRLGGGRWYEIPLPVEGQRHARLRFAVEGSPALAAFLSPSIGPATSEVARRDDRPDIILVLLDTLRADALSFYGGDPDIAPGLNAFGEKSVRFQRAWAPASWTLPSQSSMLSGLQPEQHGTVKATRSLPPAIVTVAEHLQQAGYRTGATTEALFVARRYGMDQGFEFFFENRRRRFQRTLDAADDFLESGDGRPSFLFLHTYRVHTPYRLGPEENREPMRKLLADWDVWKAADDPDEQFAIELGERLHALYYGGVTGLDTVLGPWLSKLESQGYFDRGYMVITSDHGEALQDHGVIGHGGRHWEERIRIPLFVRGPGLLPGVIGDPVTLVDLAPTFAAFAGLAPHPAWVGSPLFQLQKERVVFTFNSDENEPAVTVHDLDHKVVAPLDMAAIRGGKPMAVFDLARDHEEENNLFKTPPVWAVDLLRGQADTIAELMKAGFEAEEIELSDEEREELKALGYGGE